MHLKSNVTINSVRIARNNVNKYILYYLSLLKCLVRPNLAILSRKAVVKFQYYFLFYWSEIWLKIAYTTLKLDFGILSLFVSGAPTSTPTMLESLFRLSQEDSPFRAK